MSLRTSAQIQEEYDAVRVAYLKALGAESYSISSGAGSRSLSRSRVKELREQMEKLEREYQDITNEGIKIVAITPVG